MTRPLRLFAMAGSPYVRRVQLVLEEKGYAYENIVLSRDKGELQTAEHLARSPRGKVPALADGDVEIYESQAIVEYLEDRYPTPPVMPDDPPGRARVRQEEMECMLYFNNAMIGLIQVTFFVAPDRRDLAAVAAAAEEVAKETDRLEQRCATRGGDHVLGAALTRADLTWLPLIEISERAGLNFSAGRFPWLTAWRDRMRERPSYDATYPDHWR